MDNGLRRWADAARPYRAAVARWGRFKRLYLHVVPLVGVLPDDASVYSAATCSEARQLAALLSPGVPTRYALEDGAGGEGLSPKCLHLNLVTPLKALAVDLPGVYVYTEQITDERGGLRGILTYLQKHPDAALNRPNKRKPHEAKLPESVRRRRYFAALDRRGAAVGERRRNEGKTRLAPTRGWVGPIPRPESVLLMALLNRLAHLWRRAALLSWAKWRPLPSASKPPQAPRRSKARPYPSRRTPRPVREPYGPERPTSGL